jgi:hypothetical protein
MQDLNCRCGDSYMMYASRLCIFESDDREDYHQQAQILMIDIIIVPRHCGATALDE